MLKTWLKSEKNRLENKAFLTTIKCVKSENLNHKEKRCQKMYIKAISVSNFLTVFNFETLVLHIILSKFCTF